MCKIAIVLACLACAGHGRRVQTPTERLVNGPPAVRQILRKALVKHPFIQSLASASLHSAQGPRFSSGQLGLRQPGEVAAGLLDLRGGADEKDAEDAVEEPEGTPEAPVADTEEASEMSILKATYVCNELRASALEEALGKVTALRRVLDVGEAIPKFGSVAEELIAEAMKKFSDEMPRGSAQVLELCQTKAAEMRAELMMSLEPAYVQQICLLKDAALELFKKGLTEGDGAEAFAAAEAAFVREASVCVPAQTGWTFDLERGSLVVAMKAILGEQKKATTAKLQNAQQMQTALNYLQLQQKQMEEIQGQAMRAQSNKWTVGAAWRPDDSNINLSAAYQQGRCNLQVSMVPDESAGLLGQNGFTGGVAPANLGLSFNIHF